MGGDDVAVIAGDAPAIDDLGCVLRDLGDLAQLPGSRADANDAGQAQAEGTRIYLGVIAENHLLLLEASEALGHRRRGQSDSPAQFGVTQSRVGLKLGEETEIYAVEQTSYGAAAIAPLIRRHQDDYTWDLPCTNSLGWTTLWWMSHSTPADEPPAGRVAVLTSEPPPHVYFVVSAVFHYLGPSFAVLLFVRVPVLGVAWLRIASAAVIFALWRAPWRTFAALDRDGRRLLVGWGIVLALMNACFYTAISRVPLGTVAAIEFLPVIGLAVLGARSRRNLMALGLAAPGVYLLTDVRLAGHALGLGFAFANAILFALYIVLADRVAKRPQLSGIDGLAAAMLIAAVAVTPIGGWQAGPAFLDPVAILAGIGVGVSSSVVPYVTDQLAMARLPRATYALMVALLPAIATVIGIVVLTQIPTPLECAGVALVIAGVALHRPAADGA